MALISVGIDHEHASLDLLERARVADGPTCVASVSVGALRRIAGNLLENALRYGEGHPVDLEVACRARSLTVGILDRGPGIPEAARDAVFQPFHRLENSRSRDTGGSGLGLAIVRQLADAQGWRIALKDREGGGLRAEVVIPRK